MANSPKKTQDPTEVALSAIQEALNMSETQVSEGATSSAPSVAPPVTVPELPHDEAMFGPRPFPDQPSDEALFNRGAANDDRETIGQILQAIQKGRPARNIYTLATIFTVVWLIGAGLLAFSFYPSLQSLGQNGGALAFVGLTSVLLAPILLFYFLASLAWRGQELRMIAQSMAQVAMRFSEPEHAASDSMVTVGQAIRREVAAMGDGMERAIARAGELETLVANEVS
ncbi:MAG: hypothetical protein J0H25_17955, partial [Rhizobiales bacterium]|nr:hypothetical protein [Hyphomicrobiales bacterium]